MEYVYIISNVLLILSTIIIKKKNEKINFIPAFIITIVLLMCYNAMIAYILNIVSLPINLTSMTIVKIATIVILWVASIIKNKKVELQKYHISIGEIIFLGIILLINIPILYREFNLLDNFRFISTDATMHATVAKKFCETEALVSSLDGIEAVNPTFLIGGYVNLGMLFKTFIEIIGEEQLYKLYILFDCTIYILIGILFYYVLKQYTKESKAQEIIAGILSIIYMLGYPLNSLITGFHYFTLGILEVISIIYILNNWEGNKDLLSLFLLNTGILLTYNLFAPVVYIIELIVIVRTCKKETGKIITLEAVKEIIVSILIPGIIGICFFVLPRIVGNIHLEHSQNLNVDGYIYINYWSNLLPFIPFVICGIVKQLKSKKYTVGMIALLVMLIYTDLFLIGKILGKVSTYYYMKNYYILMMFVIIVAFQGIVYLIEKGKIGKWIARLAIGSYILIMGYHLLFTNVGPYNFVQNPDTSIMDIYNSNKAIMRLMQNGFSKERLEALKYMKKNEYIKGQNTLLISNTIDEHLLQFFFNYQNRKNLELQNKLEEIEEWNKGNYEFLIVFDKDYYLQKYEQIQKRKIIFEKENVVIYKNEK